MEVVGAVASGATFAEIAVRVAATLFKLKKIWDEIQDAPQSLKDLLDRTGPVETMLQLTATTLTECPMANPVAQSLSKECLKVCEKALEELNALVAHMSRDITSTRCYKRNVAGLKAVVKKDRLLSHESRLKNALSNLQFANLLCIQARMVSIPHEAASLIVPALKAAYLDQPRIEKIPDAVGKEEAGCAQDTLDGTATKPSKKRAQPPLPWVDTTYIGRVAYINGVRESKYIPKMESQFYGARLRLPQWLSRKVLDFQAYQASFSWKFQIRSYAVVPDDALVTQYACNGNLQGMLELFRQGKGSPFDRDDFGGTLLHHAAVSYQLDVCKLLYECGVNPLEVDLDSQTAFADCIMAVDRLEMKQSQKLAFFDYVMSEDFLSDDLSFEWVAEAVADDSSLFEIVVRKLFPNHYRDPVEDRMTRFRTIFWTHNTHSNDVQTMRLVLSQDGVPSKEDIQASVDCGRSILHVLMNCYGSRLAQQFKSTEGLDEISAFVREVITKSGDLHALQDMSWVVVCSSGFLFTPLAAFFTALLDAYLGPRGEPEGGNNIRRARVAIIDKATRRLIGDLESAGVNLEEFGKREKRLLSKQQRKQGGLAVTWRKTERYSGDLPPIALTGLDFGPRADDWTLHWFIEYEEYAGDFWKLADRESGPKPLPRIPGAWVDD